MLTRIRQYVSSYFEKIAKIISTTGLKPNHLTIASLLSSLIAFISLYFYGSIPLYISMALLSGLMDVLDGALARISGLESRQGAFLDSTLDRLSDVLLIYPLVKTGFTHELVTYLIVVSLMISYVRARGETLGLKIEGIGIIERAERILLIVLIVILYPINTILSQIVFYLLLILSTITLIQRITYVIVGLKHQEISSGNRGV